MSSEGGERVGRSERQGEVESDGARRDDAVRWIGGEVEVRGGGEGVTKGGSRGDDG